jgi:hypothetical protein
MRDAKYCENCIKPRVGRISVNFIVIKFKKLGFVLHDEGSLVRLPVAPGEREACPRN